MPIDTKIEGNPESVRGAANWLRSTLSTKVSDTTSQIYKARNSADAGWQDDAGSGFRAKMTNGGQKADALSTTSSGTAGKVDTFASAMQTAQGDMARIRSDAASAGLKVNGDVIQEPGAAPPRPGPAPMGPAATPDAVNAHGQAVQAANDHAAQVSAYQAAERAANAARGTWKLALDTLKNVWNDLTEKPLFTAGDLLGGAGETAAAIKSSQLLKHSKFMSDEAAKFLNMAKNAPAGTTAQTVYRDVDTSRALSNSADDLVDSAETIERDAGKLAKGAGAVLAVGGIAYDIANGKPAGQAIVSGGIGFAASVGAGAAIGTLIPIPVVGTALGAVGGAVVGLFASGAVDTLYQDGIGSVGKAIDNGAQAVGDAGKAVGHLAEDAWNAIF